MSNVNRDYRVRIATLGAADVAGNVALTIDSVGGDTDGFLARTGLANAEWGGQDVRPLDGRTVSQPWTIVIAESQAGEEFTTHLADTDDRSHLMRRLLDISVSEDAGSNWTVQATGRISEIREIGGAYEVTVMDERMVERETTVFTGADTTAVYPMGLRSAWAGFEAVDGLIVKVASVFSDRVQIDTVGAGAISGRGSLFLTTGVKQLIIDDLLVNADPTVDTLTAATQAGSFDTLRAELSPVSASVTPSELKGVVYVDVITQGGNEVGFTNDHGAVIIDPITVMWDGTDGDAQPSVGDTFHLRLVMPTHEPTRDLPKHIGGDGTHAVQVAKDLLTDAGVRIDTTAFDDLISDKEIPEVSFRVTQPENLASWLEANVWQPFGMVPLHDAQGRVSPKKVMQTTADEVPDVTTLTNLTSSEVTEHPAWRGATNELVTELRFHWQSLKSARNFPDGKEPDGADALSILEKEVTEQHDRLSTLGTRSVDISMAGIHDKKTVESFAASQAKRIFNRFGDGPIFTEKLPALKSAETLTHGEFIILSVPTYPNLVGSTRGGDRMLQVISRRFSAAGPTLDLLDAGPKTQPLAAPSLSCIQNVANPKTAIDVTISSLPTGAGYLLQQARNATEPAADSDLWVDIEAGDADETITVDGLPSGTTVWFRARSVAPNRISSLWSTATSCATEAMSAPTGLSSANVTGCSFDLSWTLGESDFSVQVTLDGDAVLTLSPGATEAEIHDGFANIEVSTSYTVGVRHVDGFGGQSALTTLGVTTTATPDTGPTPLGAIVLAGKETNAA